MKGTISGDLDTKEERGRSKLSEFEVAGQLCNNSLDGGNRATCKCNIINEDEFVVDIRLWKLVT